MRLHHYPGLFGDPRSRGLTLAVGISLAVHLVLLVTVGRIHTRPMERNFFTPVHMVDLVERPAAPAGKPAAPAAPEPAKAKAPPPEKPVAPKQAPAQPKPAPQPDAVKRITTKPQEAPKPEPPSAELSEERISERIARMREKFGAPPPATETADTAVDHANDNGRVDEAIASIRQRVGPSTTGGGAEKVGVRGGSANTLQQVRLRAYYNQLWDHVTSHWAIPPSLKGRDYDVIVSVILDRQGTLVRSWVEEPSGSNGFDQSALRALQRAQPLPPIPDSVSGDTLEVGFRFHPD